MRVMNTRLRDNIDYTPCTFHIKSNLGQTIERLKGSFHKCVPKEMRTILMLR